MWGAGGVSAVKDIYSQKKVHQWTPKTSKAQNYCETMKGEEKGNESNFQVTNH